MASPPTAGKAVLVTGATGKQGRAFISALLATEGFNVLAMTRSPDSPAAKSLLRDDKRVKLVKGDLDDVESVKKVLENDSVWGVFAVLAFPGLGKKSDGEERQGKTLIDVAKESGVQYFVYSSAGRGEDDKVDDDHAGKLRIEEHLKQVTTTGDMKWTIIRPGFFMENFVGTIGKITVGVMKAGLNPETRLQLIAAEDIGHVGAALFTAATPLAYASREIPVIGDAKTMSELGPAYRAGSGGASLPSIPHVFAWSIIKMNRATQELMSQTDHVHGSSDAEEAIQECKSVYPGMMTFEDWVRKGSMSGQRGENWNQVSVWKLMTGKM